MRRGEVWRYQGISRSRPVLIVSCDELNEAEQPIVVDVTSFSPQGAVALLTVRVGDELGGYARCRTISFGDSKRFTELLGTVPAATMEQVRSRARTVQRFTNAKTPYWRAPCTHSLRKENLYDSTSSLS